MNYVIHTRAAFAQLAAEPEATAQDVSLYVALFQQWNNAHFPASIVLFREELLAAAHIGSCVTYLKCLRNLTRWGLITYQPSQSQHRPSRALMHELTELHSEVSQAMDKSPTTCKSDASYEPTPVLTGEQAAEQDMGSITKTVENSEKEETLLNFSKPAAAGSKKKESHSSPDEQLLHEPSSLEECRRPKEKVAPKRKGNSTRPSTASRPAPRPEIPFAQSELADPESFAAAFAGTDFELANLRYYHEKVANWRKDGQPPLRRDWKATAKNFMLNDVERNALVLAPSTQRNPINRAGFSVPAFDEYVSPRYT